MSTCLLVPGRSRFITLLPSLIGDCFAGYRTDPGALLLLLSVISGNLNFSLRFVEDLSVEELLATVRWTKK